MADIFFDDHRGIRNSEKGNQNLDLTQELNCEIKLVKDSQNIFTNTD